MNDELDALRSFRPEATGPTDALQLQERTAFMETLAHALTCAPRRKPRLGLRRRIALGIVAALVIVGTATAAGMIPGDVQQALGLAAARTPDASLTPQIDLAVERTSASTVDGGKLELWTAPTTGGGTCAYLRQLDAAGAPTDPGPISCAVSIGGRGRMGEMTMTGQSGSHAPGSTMTVGGPLGDGRLNAEIQTAGGGAAMVFGQAPDSVAKVEVVDSAGVGPRAGDCDRRLVPAHAPRGRGGLCGLAGRSVVFGRLDRHGADRRPNAGTLGRQRRRRVGNERVHALLETGEGSFDR